MIICVAGKNNIAVDSVKFLLSFIEKEKLCVLLNKTDDFENNWQKSLGYYAKKNDIKICKIEELYLIPDLFFFSLEYDKIIQIKKFKSPQLFNLHFSLLPEFKGMYTSVLPIIKNKRESGVTLHKIDMGIDTGAILFQENINISFNDSSKDLYDKYINAGTKLFKDNVKEILNNNFTTIEQTYLNSSYYSKSYIDFRNLDIDFNKSAYQIYNYLRGVSFREYQLPIYNDSKIYKSKILYKKSDEKPNTLIFEDEECYIVSSIDYNIKLFKDYYDIFWGYCKDGDIEMVQSVFKYIPNINTKNNCGWDALIISVYNNHLDLVKYLINAGANLLTTNYKGTNLLMYARSAGKITKDYSMFKFLLTKEIDINWKDDRGLSVLDYATKEKQNSLINIININD
jgi:methionyl-tRNA formyltransferase